MRVKINQKVESLLLFFIFLLIEKATLPDHYNDCERYKVFYLVMNISKKKKKTFLRCTKYLHEFEQKYYLPHSEAQRKKKSKTLKRKLIFHKYTRLTDQCDQLYEGRNFGLKVCCDVHHMASYVFKNVFACNSLGLQQS